jgi:hypothetical protein
MFEVPEQEDLALLLLSQSCVQVTSFLPCIQDSNTPENFCSTILTTPNPIFVTLYIGQLIAVLTVVFLVRDASFENAFRFMLEDFPFGDFFQPRAQLTPVLEPKPAFPIVWKFFLYDL